MFCIVHTEKNKKDLEVRPLTIHSFTTIQNAVTVRQSQNNSLHRQDSICMNVPFKYNQEVHGQHCWCCQNLH